MIKDVEFAELWSADRRTLISYVWGRLGCTPRYWHLAEDIADEAYLRAWRGRGRWAPIPGHRTPHAWIRTIAVNIIRDMVKSPSWRESPTAPGGILDQADPTAEVALDLVECRVDHEGARETLIEMLDHCTGDQRDVLLRHYMAEEPYRKIADDLCVAESAIKALSYRGLRACRRGRAGDASG